MWFCSSSSHFLLNLMLMAGGNRSRYTETSRDKHLHCIDLRVTGLVIQGHQSLALVHPLDLNPQYSVQYRFLEDHYTVLRPALPNRLHPWKGVQRDSQTQWGRLILVKERITIQTQVLTFQMCFTADVLPARPQGTACMGRASSSGLIGRRWAKSTSSELPKSR